MRGSNRPPRERRSSSALILDTVPPSGELRPVVEDGLIRNAGGTILGADNKAAIVQMLEGVRRVLVENVAHAGIELLFTRQEEIGLLGAAALRPHASSCRARLRLRPGRTDRRDHPRRAVCAGARDHLPRPSCSCGNGARGRAVGHPGGGEGDRRSAARPRRRGDDRERRRHSRRNRGQHRSRRLLVSRRGALPERAEARRCRAGDARRVRVRGQRDRVRAADRVAKDLQRLPLRQERRRRPAGGGRARGLWVRGAVWAVGWGGRREHLQRARPPLSQSHDTECTTFTARKSG